MDNKVFSEVKVGIRLINPEDDRQMEMLKHRISAEVFSDADRKQLDALRERETLKTLSTEDADKLMQLRARASDELTPEDCRRDMHHQMPDKLPIFVDNYYFDPHYLKWMQGKVAREHPEIKLQNVVIDAVLVPRDETKEPIVMPFAVASVFEYEGRKFLGPLIVGHFGSINDAKGRGHPNPNLPADMAEAFPAEVQSELLYSVLQQTLDHAPSYSGVVAALPTGGRPMSALQQAGSNRIMHGRNVTTGEVERDSLVSDTFIKDKFVYYCMPKYSDPNAPAVFSSPKFQETCAWIRGLGETYAREQGNFTPLRRVTREGHQRFMREFIDETGLNNGRQ